MKRAAIALLALVLVMSATLPGLAAKSHEGETLVVGVWGGVIEELIREYVVKPLETETGCKVQLLLGGTGDRLAKIYAEKGNPTMDIAFLNIYEAPQAMKDGVTEAPGEKVRTFRDLYPAARIGGYGMSFMGLGIVYNTEKIKTPPQWKDLWDPKYRGKIAFPNYPSSEGDGLLAIAARVAGADEHNPDVAFDMLKKLKPIPLVYSNLDELFLMMKMGDVWMAPLISGYAYTYKEKGYPVAFSWPTGPGPVKMMDVLCIVKGTKHPELAARFAELATGVECQTAYAERISFGPTNSKVVLKPEVAERLVYGESRVKSLVELDWDYIIKQRPTWTDRWNREILGKK